MYHPYNKNDVRVRNALYTTYRGRCFYCKRPIEWRDMFVDHIIPDHLPTKIEDNVFKYLNELNKNHFIKDSIENYLPTCYSCNNGKRNKVFSEASLRFYHEIALSNIDKVLSLIAKDKSHESYYEPVDTDIWEEIDFSMQHDLSYAIMGYRLSQADVLACPRLKQVERIKKQLDIVDYTFVSGDPGCGKSISAYQVGYDYYNAGWHVYKYIAYNDSSKDIIIPINSEKSVYIIDDAQVLPDHIIESIKTHAQATTKVIFCRTISLSTKDDTILITKKDAVDVLYQYYLKKSKDIISIVHKYDKCIGVSLTDTPIEHRLLAAKEATSPWQFNYVLRGGWQTMLEKYSELCSYNHRDLLVAIISACQVLTLDHSSDYNWLCKEINSLNNSVFWTHQDLSELINQNIVISEKDVRIVHIESANIILSYFLENSEKWKRDILQQFIENNYLNNTFSIMGLVWFANGIRRHCVQFETHLFPLTDKVLSHTLDNIKIYTVSKDRAGIAYILDLINHSSTPKYLHYFYKHEKTLVDWIENANNQTAYAYSLAINTLINHDKDAYKKIASQIDWTKIQNSFLLDPSPNYYSWGKLFERLLCFISKSQRHLIGLKMKPLIDYLTSKASISIIAPLSCFFCLIIRSNETNVHQAIKTLIPVYKQYFAKDMLQAIEIFDFDFLMYICGYNYFGKQHPTKQQAETANILVSAIPEQAMANTISNCFPRVWHSILPLMEIITKYDRSKAKDIISQIDLFKLSKNADSSWAKVHEISEICYILSLSGTKVVKSFIGLNTKYIQTIYSTFIVLSPKTSIQLYDDGHAVELVTDHWWDLCLSAIKKLVTLSPQKATNIIMSSIDNIVQSINTSTTLECNDKSFLDFVIYMKNTFPLIFDRIKEMIDKMYIKQHFHNGAIYSHKESIVEKRKKTLFSLLDID